MLSPMQSPSATCFGTNRMKIYVELCHNSKVAAAAHAAPQEQVLISRGHWLQTSEPSAR